MDADKPLIVPEVNLHHIKASDRIIANPNCSTIQMVAALAPLHTVYQIDRLVIATYQSMTGTGVSAVRQYEAELQGKEVENPPYPHPIFQNCLPHCDVFFENGYTREELKLVHETRKIMGDDNLRITATAVRVPVQGGHSEAINIEFKKEFELKEIYRLLRDAPGLVVMDDIQNNVYPMPLQAQHKNLWIVADNLRKGAATNAVQIAEYLLQKNWIGQQKTITYNG